MPWALQRLQRHRRCFWVRSELAFSMLLWEAGAPRVSHTRRLLAAAWSRGALGAEPKRGGGEGRAWPLVSAGRVKAVAGCACFHHPTAGWGNRGRSLFPFPAAGRGEGVGARCPLPHPAPPRLPVTPEGTELSSGQHGAACASRPGLPHVPAASVPGTGAVPGGAGSRLSA